MPQRVFLEFYEVQDIITKLYIREKSWGNVSKILGISKGTLHRIAVMGIEPKDKEIRKKLGLATICPYCKSLPTRRKRPKRIRDMKKDDLLWALENREEMIGNVTDRNTK